MLCQTVPLSSVLEVLPQQRINALQQYAFGENPQKTKRSNKTQDRVPLFNGGASIMMTTIQSKADTLPPIDQNIRYRQNTQASNSKSPKAKNKKHIYGGGDYFTQKIQKKQPSLYTQQSNSTSNPLRSSSQTNRFNKTPSRLLNINQNLDIDENNRIGQGNFGVVFKAEFKDTKEEVAVKRVLQDKNFKNRELQIMQEVSHHLNIVQLKYNFYSFVEEEDEVYLNLIMEYVPSNLTKMIKYYHRKKLKQFEQKEQFPNILIKLYLYQSFRALAYLNGLNIAHRDIKPSNILINHRTHQLKFCDFGSAKKLSRGESNISYICSRFYRAPELMLGASNYTTSIDVWSLGCVVAEMLLGEPLFKGSSSLDQLVEVMKVLGAPTPEQIKEMNPEHKLLKYPPINKMPLSKVFESVLINRDLLDLLEQMLVYEPSKRMKPLKALLHPYFNELRIEHCRINGKRLPPLFDFLEEELSESQDKQLTFQLLTPKWYQLLKQAGEDKNHFNYEY
ncbi:hypothetical protein ABPG72_007685 [Tetrahymena utriculariae]